MLTAMFMMYGSQQKAKTPTSMAITFVTFLFASGDIADDCRETLSPDFPSAELILGVGRVNVGNFLKMKWLSSPFLAICRIKTFMTTIRSRGKMKLAQSWNNAYSVSK